MILASIGESRLEKVRSKRRMVRRISMLVVVVLVIGLAAGDGANLIFGKPRAGKAATTSPPWSSKKTTGTSPASKAASERGPASPQFSSPQAMAHAFALSEQIGPRPAGSVKESGAADYIVS